MKTLFGLLCAISFGMLYTNAYSQHDTTVSNIKLQGAAFGLLNMYSGNFRELPDFKHCCVDFDGGSGLGGALGLGLEYNTNWKIGEEKVQIGALLSYSLLSGKLSAEEFVGNVIRGQEVIRGTSNHILTTGYGVLALEPYIAIPLPSIPNLYFSVGVQAGIPVSQSYTFSEKLEAPADPDVVFENGSRERNVQAGDLQDGSSLVLHGVVGLRYNIQLAPFMSIVPSVAYIPSFTTITSSTNWSVSAVRFGAVFQYQLHSVPENIAPPPPPPPAPEPPRVVAEIQKPAPPTIQLQIEPATQRYVQRNDTLFIQSATEQVRIVERTAASTIFFEKNSTSPLLATTPATEQQEIVASINKAIADNPSAKITVIGSASMDEEPQILRQRVSWLINQLGIPVEQITVQTATGPMQERTELNEDYRFVRIRLDNTVPVLTMRTSTAKKEQSNIQLRSAAIVSCFGGPCATQIKASVNNINIATVGNEVVQEATVPAAWLQSPAHVMFVGTITDSLQQQSSVSEDRVIVPQVYSSDTIVTRLTDGSGLVTESEVLGYFNFAEKEFSSINQEVLQRARAAVQQGMKITLLPGTDSFGDVLTNETLQRERAQHARKVLGATEEQTRIVLNVANSSPNNTPMGRYSNRCVRVIIGR